MTAAETPSRSQWPGKAAVASFPVRSLEATGAAGEALASESDVSDAVTAIDALATLLTATNTKLDSIVTGLATVATKLDTIAGKQDTGNASLAAIKTNTDRIP